MSTFISFSKTLTESFTIFSRNKHVYFLIFILLTLPLSLLHFSLSLTTYPIKSRILHLEYLASRAPTRFESRQVWRESREIALSLFRLKLFYSIPSYILSLLAAITVVISAESVYDKKPTTIQFIIAAVKTTWLRPLLTSFCIYAILLLYSSVPHTVLAIIGSSNPQVRFGLWVFGAGLELYIMAVLGMSLVVSILEVRTGWAAIRVGWRLMEGRRTSGWFLCCLMTVVTAVIEWQMEGLMVISDDSVEEPRWMVSDGWEKVVLIGVYAVAVIWGFTISVLYYCERRKRQVVLRKEEEEEEEEEEPQPQEVQIVDIY